MVIFGVDRQWKQRYTNRDIKDVLTAYLEQMEPKLKPVFLYG